MSRGARDGSSCEVLTWFYEHISNEYYYIYRSACYIIMHILVSYLYKKICNTYI